MIRAITMGLTLSAALILGGEALADTSAAAFQDGVWYGTACVSSGGESAARISELKAQAAIVREREADRIYGHEVLDTKGERSSLRISSYSGGKMGPIRVVKRWIEHDADGEHVNTCVRVMEQSLDG